MLEHTNATLIAPNGDTYTIWRNFRYYGIRVERYGVRKEIAIEVCPHYYLDFKVALNSCDQHHDTNRWINPSR